MAFDHTAAATQIAGNIAYVGELYSLADGTSFAAAMEEVPVEFAVSSSGVERLLHCVRSDFATIPSEGALITDSAARVWRLVRAEPGPHSSLINLRVVAELR